MFHLSIHRGSAISLHYQKTTICLNNGFYLEEQDLYVNCNLSKLSVSRQVHLRNFMYKIKDIEDNILLKDDVQMDTILHDGPVFKISHPKNEPIKRSVMCAGALEWMQK